MDEKHTTAGELRRIIAACCKTAEAADKVAMQALEAFKREQKLRQDAVREIRSRVATLERLVGKSRAR